MKYIDIHNHPRKDIYSLFKEYENPYFSLTTEIDITVISEYAMENGLSLFKVILYVTMNAMNRFPELKQRIRQENIIEHDIVHPSFTVLNEDGAFNFCTIDFNTEFKSFYQQLQLKIEDIKHQQELKIEPDRDDLVYVSCLPWVSFTQITHPVRIKGADSVPRVAWGKYKQQAGKVLLPFNVQVHHALVDGYHLGQYFQYFDSLVSDYSLFQL